MTDSRWARNLPDPVGVGVAVEHREAAARGAHVEFLSPAGPNNNIRSAVVVACGRWGNATLTI
jgi:hypothetical protein